jgi:catechol 2,3-dioxygenase-like lactoylglutathione lyase family enzyme
MAHVEASTSPQATERRSPIRVKKLGHVVIQARDIERSLRFYTEVMNFRISDRGRNGAVFLTAVGDHHTVALFPSDGENAQTPAEGGVRLNHFALEVGSLEELFEIRSFYGNAVSPSGRRRALGCRRHRVPRPDGFTSIPRYRPDRSGRRSRPRYPSPPSLSARDNQRGPVVAR